ncbi:hypothetical protein GCM10009802_31260 [Streptomyces synnematoformans]|uniref:Uncharacterized protein n=1 Tax=Streptomyces synnematoformans TaxID=415721 RepID=A0ABN2YEU1_9ACTN
MTWRRVPAAWLSGRGLSGAEEGEFVFMAAGFPVARPLLTAVTRLSKNTDKPGLKCTCSTVE